MKKLLLLGSVVAPCPPKKQGGTERVAYCQAKELARRGVEIIFVTAVGSKNNFEEQLLLENEDPHKILPHIEFVEIGGGTAFGNQADSIITDPSQIEASRKLRLEMVNLSLVTEIMVKRRDEYDIILNNMRGEAIFIPFAKELRKKFISVMHLNIFPELAALFEKYNTYIITISNAQRVDFPSLNYLATIYNPINSVLFPLNTAPQEYALMLSTIGYHKNQKEAIAACRKAGIPLILSGKIRDQDYYDKEVKPFLDDINVTYHGEIDFETKLRLYQSAKVFLFPILWQEPFGLVVIEALACGTPVIAYPHGGPKEIIEDGKNGFLVNSVDEMAEKIKNISSIDRTYCHQDIKNRFDENIIGQQYYQSITSLYE